MKAAYIHRFGPPQVIQYGELPDPGYGAGEVLVRVAAASVNAADWKSRSGQASTISGVRFPYALGRDFSGVVVARGEQVTDLDVGDEVFGVIDMGTEGAYAEFVAVPAAIVARKPASMSHAQAAALALTGLTSIVCLEEALLLQRGESILVLGGAGGVGGFSVQLGRHLGAKVLATASESNHDYVRSLGADDVLDYRARKYWEEFSGCDTGLDTVGGTESARLYAALRSGGRCAYVAGALPPEPSRGDITVLRPLATRRRVHMERVADLFVSGAVRSPEITTFKLADAAAAHEISEARHLRGKLVLAP